MINRKVLYGYPIQNGTLAYRRYRFSFPNRAGGAVGRQYGLYAL